MMSSDDMTAFATADDLEKRWHALTPTEKHKATTLLDDASDLIRTTCPDWQQARPSTLRRICCAVAKRAMLAGDDTAGAASTPKPPARIQRASATAIPPATCT